MQRLSEVIPMSDGRFVVASQPFYSSGSDLSASFGFSRAQQIAVGIAGSQKTLMVGLDIAITYVGGLAILPMVVYHVAQLLADTVIADRLRS